MCVTIGELHHLVLDGGTIAGSGTFDPTGIKGGAIEIPPNYFMRFRRCFGDPAGALFHVEQRSAYVVQRENVLFQPLTPKEGEARRWLVAQLNLALRKIDRAAVQPAGRAGLEPTDLKPVAPQIFTQP